MIAHLFDTIVRVWRPSSSADQYRVEVRALELVDLTIAPNAKVNRPSARLRDTGPGLAAVGTRVLYMDPDDDVQLRDVLQLASGPDAGMLLEVDQPPTRPRGHHLELRCIVWNGQLPEDAPDVPAAVAVASDTVDHLFDTTLQVWRPAVTLNASRVEVRTLERQGLATAANAAVNRPSAPLGDRGPGLAPIGTRVVYMNATADVRERDVLEISDGPDAPQLLEVDAPPTRPRGHHLELTCRIYNGQLPEEEDEDLVLAMLIGQPWQLPMLGERTGNLVGLAGQ